MDIKKIEIVLCDDHMQLIDQLEIYLEEYLRERHVEYHIHKFLTPSEAFEYMNHEVVHILFMDLEFGKEEEDGMLWTKKIHDAFPGTLVLILTAYEYRYKEGYRARAFRFMTKPLMRQEFEENMDDCLQELDMLQAIWIKQKNINIQITVKDILYIKAYVGESELHTKEKLYYSEESLSQWEIRLQEKHFFRIHKSYLINMAQVTDIVPNRHEIVLGQEVRLPVSRRKWTEFQSCYIRYDVSRNS